MTCVRSHTYIYIYNYTKQHTYISTYTRVNYSNNFGSLCRCHEIKSPPKQSLPLTDMKFPPETLCSKQSLPPSKWNLRSTIQSLSHPKIPPLVYFAFL